MDADALLRAFAEMPLEERRALRAEILLDGSDTGWCSEAVRRRIQAMLREIEASEDPTAMYRELARRCLERASLFGEPDALTPPRGWTRTWVIPEAW